MAHGILIRLSSGILLSVCLFAIAFAQPKTGGYAGKMDGVKSWQLPNAPSGTRPDQCWHAIGSAPDGDIYISGHDHATNSMLYRLNQKDDTLRWVGDARTASQTANNWQNGETCQKFHDRPVWYNGKVYVASLDRSTLDNAFQSTRGFHWYAYDIAQNTFTDLSASEPSGIGAAKMQLICIQPDPAKNVMYGSTIPECKFVSYDIAKKTTTMLNRPSQWTAPQYIYSNRFMFVDSRSRLYISAGNERAQWYMGEDKNLYNKMFYYDPASGFGVLNNFPLQGANAIEAGEWNRDHSKCYCTDDQGHLFCFTDNGASWSYLGRPGFDAGFKVWTLEVSPDGEKLYVGRCDNTNAIFEFDIAAKTSRQICTIAEIDAQAGTTAFLTGYDSWDRNGNFYVADFSMNDGRNVIMTRINPVRIKVAKGLLPALVEVSVTASSGNLVISRTGGATTAALKVIYEVAGVNGNGATVQTVYGETTIPAGQASLTLASNQVQRPTAAGIQTSVFYVMPDGNDYITGSAKSVTLGAVAALPYSSSQVRNRSMVATFAAAGGTAIFALNIAVSAHVKLSVYSMQGQLLTTLADKRLDAGTFTTSWRPAHGSGMYTVRFDVDGKSECSRFVCLH
jgi:hypothetical protein